MTEINRDLSFPMQKSPRRAPRLSFSDPVPTPNPFNELSPLTPEIKKYSKEKVLKVFQSQDFDKIFQFTQNVTDYLHNKDRDALSEVAQDFEVIDSIMNAINDVKNEEEMSIFTHAMYPFLKANPEGLIDAGILFSIRELMEKYPHQVLDFYEIVPVVSPYGRDSMLSLGILEDILNFISTASDHEDRILAGRVLNAQFTIESSFDTEDLRPLIPKIIQLAKEITDDTDTLASVLMALAEIDGREPMFSEVYVEEGMIEFIESLIDNEDLTSACLILAGNMAICDVNSVRNIISKGLIEKVISIIGSKYTGSALYVLSGLVESSPEDLWKFITDDLIDKILESIRTLQKPHEKVTYSSPEEIYNDVGSEGGYFLATALMFVPTAHLEPLKKDEVIFNVGKLMKSPLPEVAARSLDAMSRILILAKKDKDLGDRLKKLDNGKMEVILKQLENQKLNPLLKEMAINLEKQIEHLKI